MKLPLFVYQLLSLLLLSGTAGAENLRIRVVDQHAEPLYGVYVVDLKGPYLLTTTDENGICIIDTGDLSPRDSVQFYSMGYEKVNLPVASLSSYKTVTLQQKMEMLEEVVVSGQNIASLLKEASRKLQKHPKAFDPECRYSGMGQYMKLTECRGKVMECRREYGCFLTSGNVKAKTRWDLNHRFYFVPAYAARSFNLAPDGDHLLSPLYVTGEYDAGERKIFTLMRAIQLYGPLFFGTKYYDFRAVDTDDNDYTFTFRTKKTAYPADICLFANGTVVIDRERHELKSMTFDYLDYQLFRLNLSEKLSTPFSTKVKIEFASDDDGVSYVKSCRQETSWKHNIGGIYDALELPSLRNPNLNALVEREAFSSDTYDKTDAGFWNKKAFVKIHLAQLNPRGEYDSTLFALLPELIDGKKAEADLSHYQSLHQQFQRNSDVNYYPDKYILGCNNNRTVDGDFLVSVKAAREEVLQLFFDRKKIPLKGDVRW